MRTHRPIYYVPGLISLTILPLLMTISLWQHDFFKQYSMIKVVWFREADYGKGFLSNHPVRHFENLLFTGEKTKDAVVLDEMGRTLMNLTTKQDTLNGIEIQLGVTATYQALVSILNLLKLQKHRHYHLSEKSILVWYEPPPDTSNSISVQILLHDCIQTDPTKELEHEAALYHQNVWRIAQYLWPSLVLWVMMVVFSFRRV